LPNIMPATTIVDGAGDMERDGHCVAGHHHGQRNQDLDLVMSTVAASGSPRNPVRGRPRRR
jgi:hypothetical protein